MYRLGNSVIPVIFNDIVKKTAQIPKKIFDLKLLLKNVFFYQ